MAKEKDEMSVLAKVGVLVAAFSLLPVLFAFSYLNDDSAVQGKMRADRTAAREAKYRQIMVDELDRRLGNSQH